MKKTEYDLDDNGVVPECLSEMMVTEYEQSDTYNQEHALFENLEVLQKSHEILRKENEQLKYILKQKSLGSISISECSHHKNSSYNGVGSWCNECGGKWHISELAELVIGK